MQAHLPYQPVPISLIDHKHQTGHLRRLGLLEGAHSQNHFLAKNKRYGCVNCYGLWKEREKLEKQLLEKYIFLDEEILSSGNSTKKFYTIKCRKCGHIRKQPLNNLKHHLLCGCETGMYKWDADDFNSYFIKKFPDYLLMESYKGMQEKHLIKHECGFIFKQRLSDFFDKDNRHICPKCKIH